MTKHLTTLLCLFTIISAKAAVGDQFLADGLGYQVTDATTCMVTYVDGQSPANNLVIPQTVEFEGATYDVTEIDYSALAYSEIQTVKIPDSVTAIWNMAFYGCESLTSVEIGSGCERIRGYVFSDCPSLNVIKIWAVNPPSLLDSTFDEDASLTVKVPAESVDAYKNASVWSRFDIQAMDNDGIAGITMSYNLPTTYYSLDGILIGNNFDMLAPGIYVQKQGLKSVMILKR